MGEERENPPQWPDIEQPNFPGWSGLIAKSRLQAEAIKAVRRSSRGKDRSARRAMLESELERRDLELNPRWIETQLDRIEGGVPGKIKEMAKLAREYAAAEKPSRPKADRPKPRSGRPPED
jgi:hypothetical protein